MERMTRNDAAAFLGVDPQTITNWVNKGLLGGYNDKSSKRFWVNADDVKKVFREVQDVVCLRGFA